MTNEKFFPELKRYRIKATNKLARRKLSDLLTEKSITAKDLDFIFECVEPKPITPGIIDTEAQNEQ